MEKTKLDKEIENNSQTMEEVNLMLNKGNFSNNGSIPKIYFL
jgi:hypothetical protein